MSALSNEVLGKVMIYVKGREGFAKVLFDSFYRDSIDKRTSYGIKSTGQEFRMEVDGLNLGDVRAFINSNLRLLKLVIEGLKVVS
jgi:tRNA threonylcarbamoyladenosine modification (KEOPS) complex  Pcc1 subunit